MTMPLPVGKHSAAINPAYPTVWRNLSLAYYNKRDDKQKALKLWKSLCIDEHDSRILMELDQLYKRLGRPHSERLAFLAISARSRAA